MNTRSETPKQKTTWFSCYSGISSDSYVYTVSRLLQSPAINRVPWLGCEVFPLRRHLTSKIPSCPMSDDHPPPSVILFIGATNSIIKFQGRELLPVPVTWIGVVGPLFDLCLILHSRRKILLGKRPSSDLKLILHQKCLREGTRKRHSKRKGVMMLRDAWWNFDGVVELQYEQKWAHIWEHDVTIRMLSNVPMRMRGENNNAWSLTLISSAMTTTTSTCITPSNGDTRFEDRWQ